MDEPTTPLSSRETDRLSSSSANLRDEGLAIVSSATAWPRSDLSDQVSVLRDGTYVGHTGTRRPVGRALVQMMVGRDLSGF